MVVLTACVRDHSAFLLVSLLPLLPVQPQVKFAPDVMCLFPLLAVRGMLPFSLACQRQQLTRISSQGPFRLRGHPVGEFAGLCA